MDRPERPAARRRVGARERRPPVPNRVRCRLGDADVDKPAHGVAIELDLVDGLVGPGLAKLRRAIGGEDQQRNVGVVRLDHGRVEVGRRRPGGADHRGRPPAGLADSEGGESRRALVDEDVDPDRGVVGQRQRERRGTGARGEAHVGQERQRRRAGGAHCQFIEQLARLGGGPRQLPAVRRARELPRRDAAQQFSADGVAFLGLLHHLPRPALNDVDAVGFEVGERHAVVGGA